MEILYSKPERKQALLHVVCADVDGKHVGASQGSREHPGLCIHSTTQISLGSAITHYSNIIKGPLYFDVGFLVNWHHIPCSDVCF